MTQNKKNDPGARFRMDLFIGFLFCLALFLAFIPSDAFAHNGELFREEIGKIEGLLTGGYMRIGLLVVCGVTAVMGAIQQSAWMFMSGIMAAIFAYFMKDWIFNTFAYVI